MGFQVFPTNKKCKSWLMLEDAEQKEIASSVVGLQILCARLRMNSKAAEEKEEGTV